MQLNDPHMTEQALTTHKSEVEVMYWLIEDALRDGATPKAQAILSLLLYVAKYKPSLIQEGLHAPYRQRMQEICQELLGGKLMCQQQAITIKSAIQPRKLPFKLEYELKEHLATYKAILERALGEPLKIIGTEVEAGEDYRCDIVAESEKTFYPIELKIAQSTHAVVSQCSKYCYYFYRKLRYDKFKKVQGIVISSGFDTWSINELRRCGHWIYTMRPSNSDAKITLERIH